MIKKELSICKEMRNSENNTFLSFKKLAGNILVAANIYDPGDFLEIKSVCTVSREIFNAECPRKDSVVYSNTPPTNY